ncbi:bacteriohopanetetrol glucosamine biosynthesis glycosyltransferase HpnI [Siccirubricoccus sp. G192]|uniref:bacteriohopanetetrol glucosamine biosynthesis glycosyltransferase HpnI n=1 Tax=Siccirubricoccus sp. G192 TaxID=2849651 RepID=UPI001C2C9C69|nr:bacteriohopanetetrol glucosamine biosynthesis glycosyltransferase HpnI [Siccirubricoccus sp. G192]MBV1796303.1 bacteriohopanetetrol glucosamine biosynthesis glycosyltransferase HpnI [Siccirubricoccus sp. G192]
MVEALLQGLGLLAGLVALAGAVSALLAARAMRRFARLPPATAPALPASLLKPLHGAEPGLAANLAASLHQMHAAPHEVLFALRDPADPAAPIAEAAMAAAAGVPARLVRDPRLHGPNRKVSQLVNLEGLARHPVLVVSDADMRMPPHWLTAVTAPLADPAVGLVTCLYRGEPAEPGLWSRLAALGIDWQFLPNAVLGESMGRAEGCYGATMALRAETLARIGGFRALAGLLPDDHALGVAVRRLGLRVVVAPVLPAHVMREPSLPALLAHELRWARTLRLLEPGGYLGMGITYPLVPGLLAALLAPQPWGMAALALALATRLGLALTVDRALGRPLSFRRFMLLPLRDLLSFGIWGAGLARGTVVWRGRRYRMGRDGSMVEAARKASKKG